MQYMSIIMGEKRLETVPVKFSESEKSEFQRIAKSEDRGVGYIVRELALRGLAKYKQDGKLKINELEESIVTSNKIQVIDAETDEKPKTQKRKAG